MEGAAKNKAGVEHGVPAYAKGTYTPEEWVSRADAIGQHDWTRWKGTTAAWDRDKNAGLEISQVPRSNSTVAWHWKCPQGHEWQEKMAVLAAVKVPRWKQIVGRRGAVCRECALRDFAPRLRCGHIFGGLSDLSETPVVIAEPCPQCNPHEWRELRDERERRRREGALESRKQEAQARQAFFDKWEGHSLYSNAERAWRRAAQAKSRCWQTSIDPLPESAGSLKPLNGTEREVTSRYEARTRKMLEDRGFRIARTKIVVPDLVQADGATWEIAPDFVCGGMAIEVDAPAKFGGGPSHGDGWPAEDLYRDDCLRAVGYGVIRIRVGDLPTVPDAVNVVAKSISAAVIHEVSRALVESGVASVEPGVGGAAPEGHPH